MANEERHPPPWLDRALFDPASVFAFARRHDVHGDAARDRFHRRGAGAFL